MGGSSQAIAIMSVYSLTRIMYRLRIIDQDQYMILDEGRYIDKWRIL